MAGPLRFEGRVAVVTGAGGGLGRAYALELAARGARVLVNDTGGSTDGTGPAEDLAGQVVEEIRAKGGTALADRSSVVPPEGGRAIVEAALRAWGRVDALVCNAGIVSGGRITEIPDDALDRVLATHLRGSFSVTRAAWETMSSQRYGRIVLVSSGSVFGLKGGAVYPAAKAGLIGLARCLAEEGEPLGIRANAIMPIAYTRMTARIPDEAFRNLLRDYFPPENVAPLVALLCHEDAPCSGEVFTVGGRRVARVFLGVAPGLVSKQLSAEELRDGFATVMDPRDAEIPANTDEEVVLHLRALGLDAQQTGLR